MKAMFYGLSHVEVFVRNLARSRELYVDVLGFAVKREGEGWLDLETGTVTLHLRETKDTPAPVVLRVISANVEEGTATLTAAGGKLVCEATRTEQLTEMAAVQDFDGHTIIVWRELSEDECGFDPDLPTEIDWGEDAEALLKSLLHGVPALFRAQARRKIVRHTEERAQKMRVTEDTVVRAFISVTPKFMRDRARTPLVDNGYDPADYQDEFDAD